MPINSLRICFKTLKVLKKWFMSKPTISLNINSFYIGRSLDLHTERGRLGREEPSEINCILWWMSAWSTSMGLQPGCLREPVVRTKQMLFLLLTSHWTIYSGF